MQRFMPQIAWHDTKSILSVHFQPNTTVKCGRTVYKIVTTSVDQDLRIWELHLDYEDDAVKSMKQTKSALSIDFVANLSGHGRSVDVARFSCDGCRLASGDSEGGLFTWRLVNSTPPPDIFGKDDLPPNKENWQIEHRLRGHLEDITDLCFSPDGAYIVSLSKDRGMIVFDANTGKQLRNIRDFGKFANGVCWDPRGRYIVTLDNDRAMQIFSGEAPKFTRLRRITKCDPSALPVGLIERDQNIDDPPPVKLFHDEQLMAFQRRPMFSPCGELLIAPGGCIEVGEVPRYFTYVFSRNDLEKPIAAYPSIHPTFVVCVCPKLFKLREDIQQNALGLPYRVVFCTMNKDAVIVYDSQQLEPIAYYEDGHFAVHTDVAWSSDGRVLVISSLDGFNSFLLFEEFPAQHFSLGNPIAQDELPAPPLSPKLLPVKTPRRPKPKPQLTANPDPGSSTPTGSVAGDTRDGSEPREEKSATKKSGGGPFRATAANLLRFLKSSGNGSKKKADDNAKMETNEKTSTDDDDVVFLSAEVNIHTTPASTSMTATTTATAKEAVAGEAALSATKICENASASTTPQPDKPKATRRVQLTTLGPSRPKFAALKCPPTLPAPAAQQANPTSAENENRSTAPMDTD